MYISYIMKRTQIYLDESQDDQLERRAAAEGLTKSALIRRAIDRDLVPGDDADLALARFRSAVKAAAGTVSRLPRGSTYVDSLREQDNERRRRLDERGRG